MSQIRKVILHCTDTPDDREVDVKEIRRWHLARGWTDVGYHYVIQRSGKVQVGRFEDGDSVLEGREIGAHVKGHNSDSLAVCWVGRTAPTPEQNETLLAWVAHLVESHKLTAEAVYGHYELDKGKTCPNLDMPAFRAVLRTILKRGKIK